jgi:hypothetical protein
MQVSVVYETNATLAKLSTARSGEWSIYESIDRALGALSQALEDGVEDVLAVPSISSVLGNVNPAHCVTLMFTQWASGGASWYDGTVFIVARDETQFRVLVSNPNRIDEVLMLDARASRTKRGWTVTVPQAPIVLNEP